MIKFEKIEEQIIYEKIKQILIRKNTNRNKQKKIEKLMNVFLLKKQENIWFINPLWKNTILEVFNKELIEFSNIFINHYIHNEMLLKIDYIYDFIKIISDNELFNIIIYSFFENLNEDFFKQKITFISNIVNNIINYYLHIFKFIYLKKNISKYLKIDNNLSEIWFENFKNQINKLYSTKEKDFVLTYNVFILEFLKKDYEKLDKRYKIYKDIIFKFNNDFKNDLLNESKNLEKNLTKAIHILFNLLENKTEIFNNFKGNIGKKSYDYMYLFNFEIFNKINNTYYLLSQIPMIHIPKKWEKNGQKGGFLLNNKNILPLTKKLSKGFSKIEYNKFFVDSINITQEKKYRISEFYLNFIQTPIFKNENNIPEIETLKILFLEQEEIKNKINEKNFKDFLPEYKSLICSSIYKNKNINEKQILLNDLKNFFKLNDDDFLLYNKWLNSYKNFYKLYNNYKQYEFIINICKLFKEFYLYIPNKTDFRGRFYPIGRILHRASGNYKYLLYDDQDFTDFSKNNKYLNILIEYITVSFKISDEFKKEDLFDWFDLNIEKPIKDNSLNFIELYYFFESFILNKKNIQNDYLNKNLKINNNNDFIKYIEHILSLYEKASNKNNFILSLLEYFKIKSNINKISYLTVDYDQSSSGPMLYGILSKDKKMLELTNLFSCDFKKDLYNDFLNKFKEGLKNYKDIPIDIFKRNNFAKLLIMPIFYNMGDKGIKKLLINVFEENNLFKQNDNFEKKKEIINFLLKYINEILENNYTNTIIFQKNLVNICKVLKDKDIPISFYTLDGAYIEYKYIKFDYIYGFIKDIKKEKKKTYKILLPMENQNKLDNNHYLTFPPNFIQSIDGAICRIVVNIYYQITNRIIEPLHDSFRIPIKDIELLSNLLKYIYIYIFFNSYFHKNKIGINLIKNIIEKNSLYYEKYNLYFYFKQLTFKKNIIYDYFINVLKIDLETKENVINKIFEEKIYNKEFEDTEIDNILNSNFFFYF